MKTRLFSIYLFINLLMLQNSYAQVSGYGSGTFLPNPNWNSGEHYMDDVRAKVTTLSATLACSYRLTLTNATGTFQTGDIALLIQMKGSGIGTHQNVIINTITTNTMCVTPVGTSMNTYSFAGADDRVQLIKINEYQNFTLSGNAVVTCHPWNDALGTGGILCMIVNNQLIINGGLFTVAAKGFTPEEAGVTFATGSAGGVPIPTWPGGANLTTYAGAPTSLFVCNDQLYTTSASPPSPYVFTRGQDGTKAGSFGGAPNLNSGTQINYGGSVINGILVMGDPGYFKPNSNGGVGGQGGGHGGSGANSLSSCPSNTATVGKIGTPGNTGGNAGRGGNGGGAMVIKAGVININNSGIVFNASGQSGAHGQFGGDGGRGGDYGIGGPGCCDINGNVVPDGGNGGYGDVGLGGNGADAGNGGKPGYIWIVRQNSYTTSATNRSDNFRVRGGKGGVGGLGGWGNYNSTPSQQYTGINPCTGDPCPSTPACYTEYCDIDRIMCIIKNNAASCVLNGNFYEFKNSSNVIIARYHTLTGDLVAYFINSCGMPSVSRAKINNPGTSCNAAFNQFTTLSAFDFSTLTRPNLNTCTGNDVFPKTIEFIRDNNGLPPISMVSYAYPSPNSYARIINEENLNFSDQCIISTCYSPPGSGGVGYGPEAGKINPYNNSPWPTRADKGDDGEDADDGKVSDPQEPDDNIIIDEDGNWFTGTTNIIAIDNTLRVYPQPASNSLNIVIQGISAKQVNCLVYDLSGKIVLKTNAIFTSEKAIYELDISSLKNGVYILEINNQTSKIRFNVIR